MSELYQVETCTRCAALVACRKHVVNGRGRVTATIAIVGTSPDEAADEQGLPFIGKAGKLLRLMMDAAGISIQTAYITNAILCTTPDGRPPSDIELSNCRPHLLASLRALPNLKCIVALGAPALTALYGMDGPAQATYAQAVINYDLDYNSFIDKAADWEIAKAENNGKLPKHEDGSRWIKPKRPVRPKKPKTKKKTLTEIAGHTLVQPDTGLPLIPTMHPRYLMLGHWEQCEMVIEHLKKALRIAEGQDEVPELGEYRTTVNLAQLRALRDLLLHDPEATVYFDTETTGTDWHKAELLCISLSGGAGEGFVVPILQNIGDGELDWYWGSRTQKAVDILKDIFAGPNPKCGHNLLFDQRFLERSSEQPWIEAITAFGITINGPLKDTELMHAAVAEAQPHNMTSVLALHSDPAMPFYEADLYELSAGKKQMAKVPSDILWAYSAADADGLPRMEKPLMARARAEGTDWVLENVTFPMLRVCRNMEDRGIPIDMEYFGRLCDFYRDQRKIWQAKLYQVLPDVGEFRWWYSKDLQRVLFQDLHLPPSGRMTKGAKGCEDCKEEICEKHDQTGSEALKEIYENTHHPCLPILIRLKSIATLQGTFLDEGRGGWARHIKADLRIHASFKMSKVETLRLACQDPNLLNPPKNIHVHPIGGHCPEYGDKCEGYFDRNFGIDTTNAFRDIIAEVDNDKALLNLDWSQLEAFVMAYELNDRFGDSTLLDILTSGRDIHTVVGRMIYPDLSPEMTEPEWRFNHRPERDKAKVLVFGLNYGLTVQGAADRMHSTEEEADDLMKRYFKNVPGLPRYFDYVERSMLDKGYIETRQGHRRHGIASRILNAMGQRYDLEAFFREAQNFPIQAGGAILHAAAIATTDAWPALKGRAEGILSIHDSMLFEIDYPDNNYALDTAWMIKNLWEHTARTLILGDGKVLGWECKAEAQWGKSFGSPTWNLDGKGVLTKIGER